MQLYTNYAIGSILELEIEIMTSVRDFYFGGNILHTNYLSQIAGRDLIAQSIQGSKI